jgi:PAS domain S-box-containing protein
LPGLLFALARKARYNHSNGVSVDEPNQQTRIEARIESPERFIADWHPFIEDNPDAFIAGEVNGRIRYVNDAACRLLGYDRTTLLSMRVDDLLTYDEETRAVRRRELIEKGFTVNPAAKYITGTGEIRTAIITTHLMHGQDETRNYFRAILRDVTEQQRTLDTLNQRNEELSALNAIAEILSNPLELNAALDQVCAQIVSITGMETAAIYFVDESRQFLNIVAQRGMSEKLIVEMGHLGLDDQLTRSIAEGMTLALDDATAYLGSGLAGPRSEGYHALIIAPILVGEKSIGILGAGSKIKTQYERSDVDLLLNIGRQIGKAYENAKLYKEMQKRVEELDGLAKLSAACAASLDPVELAQIAIDWTLKLIPTDFANLRMLEGNSHRLVASRSRAKLVFRDKVPAEELMESHNQMQTPIIVDDVQINPVSPAFRARAESIGIRSNCVMPLPARGQLIGFISIGYVEPHHWTNHEIELVQTIANQVAGAIDNAQLFQKVVSEQRKIQAIFDSGLSGLFATDADGRIVMFNRAAERITGWLANEVQNQCWQDLFSDPSENPPAEPLINVALKHKETRYVHDGQSLRTRDGRVIPIAKAVAPLLDDQGKVTGAVGAFFDLSREQEAELEREEFLKQVAHQLRSPLTAVLSAMQLLERPNLSEARRAEMWGILKSDGERLKRFADQFLDLEAVTKSQRPLQMEPLAIISVVRALVRKFRTDQHKHRFHVRASKRHLIALADLERVENILRNLLDNAISYAPPGTRITITIKPLPNNLIQVSVQDQGPGVAYEDREKIFEPFYRSARPTSRRVYGHGLGLAIAKRSVIEMGGTIWLDSKLNLGATFHFTLRRYR